MRYILSPIRAVLVVFLACASAEAQGRIKRHVLTQEREFYAVATDGFATSTGSLLEVRGGPPWKVADVGATEGGRFLRRFGKFLFVVNTNSGSITQLMSDGTHVRTIDLGANSMPQDVLVLGQMAYITRRDDAQLHRFDLSTGTGADTTDLSSLANMNETVGLRTLAVDGTRLFVQVDLRGPLGASRGALGVVDTTNDQLLQGIPLMGAPPQLRMQILERTLYVSTTGNRLDNRGGIETVDLDTLSSTGFVLTERDFGGADLGGFVMVSPDEGYVAGHTDIVASTHLRRFTRTGGITGGPDIITLLGDAIESLTYDPDSGRLYLPTGFAEFGARSGIHVYDTRRGRFLGSSPVLTSMRVHDVVLAR